MTEQNPFLAALARGETIDVGKVLVGTTVTKAMVDDMMLAAINGEAVHTYFDGEAIRMERVDLRADSGTSAQLGHESLTDKTDSDPLRAVDEGRISGQK